MNDIDRGLVKIQFDEGLQISPLAKDFFYKLCANASAERYDADRALQHPWITRDANQQIPMTQNEALALFDKERRMNLIMKFVFFNSVVACQQNTHMSSQLTDYKKLLIQ